MIFIILSGTAALLYQLPYLRYTFYDQMAAALNLNDTQMGVLASSVSFASTLCYPIGGYFAARFSMRSLICVTLAGCVAVTVLFAFTTNYLLLIIIHILYGFFGIATLWSAYLSGIRSLGDESNQSTLFGSSEATRGITQTITGFCFLGIMNVAAAPILGFRYVLLFGAAITVVFLILAFIFLPQEEKKETVIGSNEEEEKYTTMDVLKNKGIWLTTWIIMCAYISWSLGNGYLTTYTVRVLDVSESVASTLGIIRSYVIVFLAGFLGGWLLDRFTYKGKGFILLFGIIAVLIAAIMFTSKVIPVCIGLTLVIAFIANIMKATYWSVMGQAGIPVKMTPLGTGIISFIAFLPDMIVPAICGVWLDAATAAGNVEAGFNKIFILLIAFSVAGIIGAFLLMKQTQSMDKKRVSEASMTPQI
ncbi:MFS transporter [Sporomusa sphaeroides]|nr:MFS transporter [Sporomusa sphaeroides]